MQDGERHGWWGGIAYACVSRFVSFLGPFFSASHNWEWRKHKKNVLSRVELGIPRGCVDLGVVKRHRGYDAGATRLGRALYPDWY